MIWVRWIWVTLALALAGRPAHAASAAADFFSDPGPLPRMEIVLSTESQLKLFHDHRTYVPATLSEGGTVYEEVAVRLKGNEDGSYRGLHDKPSLTLNLDRFKEDQRFRGMNKLHLNNAVEDPSYMAETIATELFRAAGIPVPRVRHVRVTLNGKERGVYVLKEGFNKRFLRQHYRSGEGNFYEGGSVTDIDEELEKSSGKGPDDRSDLLGLAAAAREINPARRWEALGEWLDRDAFIRFMAMEVITGHHDGYCMNRNNYRVYRDPASERFVFLPTGMDIMFSDPDNDIEPYMDGLVARAVIETEPGRAAFYRAVAEMFSDHFDLERILRQLEELDRRVRPHVTSLGPLKLKEYSDGLQDLRWRIQARYEAVGACVANPAAQAPTLGDALEIVLTEWRSCDGGEQADLQEDVGADEVESLYIGVTDPGLYSWRTAVRLEPGRYRFRGRVRVEAVEGWRLSFGEGAGLRAAGVGMTRRAGVIGTQDWQELVYDFSVKPGPALEIELVCDLIARRGKAWFDVESLRLARLGEH